MLTKKEEYYCVYANRFKFNNDMQYICMYICIYVCIYICIYICLICNIYIITYATLRQSDIDIY